MNNFVIKSISLSLVLVLFCTNNIIGQYKNLLEDTNIPWIAEFSTEHYFTLDDNAYYHESIKLIKFQSDPSTLKDADRSDWVPYWLYTHFMENRLECYQDSLLKNKLSKRALNDLVVDTDTVPLFDTSHSEHGYAIVSSDLDPSDIEKWKAYQVIYYDKKDSNFKTKLIALAPLIRTESGKLYPLCWIKMSEAIPNNFDLNDPNIPWCILSSTREKHLDLDLLKITKRENNFDIQKELQFQAFELKKPIESAEEFYGSNDFLSKKNIVEIYNREDTIVNFDPDNYNEQVNIIYYSLDPNDVLQFRLVQLWYYNHQKKKLVNQLKAIAPIQRIYDDNDQYKFSKPLYYIRYD